MGFAGVLVTATMMAVHVPSALGAAPTPGTACSAADVNRSVKTAKGWLGCIRPASNLELGFGDLTEAEKRAVLAASSGPGVWEVIVRPILGKGANDFRLPERLAAADACRLPEPSGRTTSLTVPQHARHPRAIGEFGVTFVPVTFPASATTPASTGDLSVLSRIAPELRMSPMDAFVGSVQTESRRKVRVIPELVSTPLVAPRPASAYGLTRGQTAQVRNLLNDLGPALASQLNAEVTKTVVLVTSDPAADYSWAWPALTSIPDTSGAFTDFVLLNASAPPWKLGSTLTHELMHIFGLPDAYRTDQVTIRGPGRLSLMAYSAPNANLTEVERWSLGWLDDGRVACLPTGLPRPERVTLDAAGAWNKTPGADNLIVIRLDTYWALAIEYRGRDGADQITRTRDGVHVYLVDSGASNRTSNPLTSYRTDRSTLDALDPNASADTAIQRYVFTGDHVEASLIASGEAATMFGYRIEVGRSTGRTAEVTISRVP